MNSLFKIPQSLFSPRPLTNLDRGLLGEASARQYLEKQGLKFLTANFSCKRGEIDLIFRDGRCLVFVEVKTRSREDWTRPAAAVNRKKQRRITKTAFAYLRQIRFPQVPIRFDIVEVLLSGESVREIRHLPNTFCLSKPYSYG